MAIVTPGVIPASVLVTHQRPDWLREWGQFAAQAQFRHLPEQTIARTRLVILDCIGAIIAGHAEPEMRQARTRMRGGAYQQAFLDGTAGTMLEIDEGNQYARGHPAIHVVPALLAVARGNSISGQAFILATALGYEIGARIGIASKLRVTMHPHGTWGVIGAALGVAKLHNADAEEIMSVVNVSSNLGLTTSRRTMLEGATVRNSYAGFSNMLGMMAWDMVQSGFTGEADGVGSVYGGIAAEQWVPDEMTKMLGHRWEVARNYFKRHAACRYNHGAMDALEKIIADAGGTINPDQIKSIHVDTYVWAAQLDHPEPASMLAAKFSMPFSLATRIVNGNTSLDSFRPSAMNNPQTRSLAHRIFINEDPALTARLPGERPARVTLTLRDGRQFSHEVATNKGDTEDPYSDDEVIAKFRDVAFPVIGAQRGETLIAETQNLEQAISLARLIDLSTIP